MIALLAVHSSASTWIRNAIMFIDTSTMPDTRPAHWLKGTPCLTIIASNDFVQEINVIIRLKQFRKITLFNKLIIHRNSYVQYEFMIHRSGCDTGEYTYNNISAFPSASFATFSLYIHFGWSSFLFLPFILLNERNI